MNNPLQSARVTVTLDGQTVEFFPKPQTEPTMPQPHDARRTVYVSLDGDDQNDAAAPDRAVKTLAKAFSMIGNHTRVLLRRGDVFQINTPLPVRQKNVLVTHFGDPLQSKPTLSWAGSMAFACMIEIQPAASDITLDGLAFDSLVPAPAFDQRGMSDAVRLAGGSRISILRCTFMNIATAINGNGNPAEVLVHECDASNPTGLRGYFAWVQGRDWTFTRNRAVNSTREHIIRVGGGDQINIIDNDFTNLDRRNSTSDPDPFDAAKNVLTIQKGSRAIVRGNKITGNVSVGPLGGNDGLSDRNARWSQAVIEENQIDGQIHVHHGASEVTIRNNTIRANSRVAISIEGDNTQFARSTRDTRIEGNVVRNADAHGNLLRVGPGATGIKLIGNRYDAPNLETGAWASALVYVDGIDLSAFDEIRDNTWPATVKTLPFARGGVFYVWPTWADPKGYITLAQWNAMPKVADDRVADAS